MWKLLGVGKGYAHEQHGYTNPFQTPAFPHIVCFHKNEGLDGPVNSKNPQKSEATIWFTIFGGVKTSLGKYTPRTPHMFPSLKQRPGAHQQHRSFRRFGHVRVVHPDDGPHRGKTHAVDDELGTNPVESGGGAQQGGETWHFF